MSSVIFRDRVQAMIKAGATLEQVKAARPTADYDVRFGATSGPWTTDMFVEAMYTSLKNPTANFSGEINFAAGHSHRLLSMSNGKIAVR